MDILKRLKEMKRVLDWNLSIRSPDILPTLNSIIEDIEKEVDNKTSTKETTTQEEITYTEEQVQQAKDFLKKIGAKGFYNMWANKLMSKALDAGFTL